MNDSDGAALVVAVIALLVSIGAAAFSGWQAVTEHLARTTPRRAFFVLVEPSRSHDPWLVLNTGGSLATRVLITFNYPLATDPNLKRRVVRAQGAVEPDKSAPLLDTGGKYFVRRPLRSKPGEPGKYERIPDGESTRGAVFALGQYASVTWDDYKGRPRRGRLRVPAASD